MTEEDLELIAKLRKLIGATSYDDDTLFIFLTAKDRDLNSVAADIWLEKAGSSGDLIDMQEGSSKRALGDLHKQATVMHAYFSGLVATDAPTGDARRSRTRAIERP